MVSLTLVFTHCHFVKLDHAIKWLAIATNIGAEMAKQNEKHALRFFPVRFDDWYLLG